LKFNSPINITKDRFADALTYLIPILISIFIFANPFPHITAVKEITFFLSAGLFFILILMRPNNYSFNSPLTLPYLLFGLWSFVGLFFALNKPNSIHDFFAHLIKYLTYYYILINFFKTRKHLLILTWLIIISSVIFSIGNVVYFYGMAGNILTERLGLSLEQIQTNLIGITTVFASLLALYLYFFEHHIYPRIFFLFSFCITIITSFMTQTRSTMFALFAAIIILFSNKKKILIVLFLFLMLLITVMPLKNRFTVDTFLHNERISTNLVTWEIIKDYPVFGIGYGMQTYDDNTFLKPYYEKVPIQYRHSLLIGHPHNLLFDTAVRTGIIGLVLFLYVIFSFFRMWWNISRSGDNPYYRNWCRCLMAAFVAIFIQGMFEPTLFGHPAIILYTIFGMMTILWRLQQAEINDNPNSVTEKVKTGIKL
jgi:hypothetical protein